MKIPKKNPFTKVEEISDVLTHEAIDNLTKDQILIFNKDGERIELKITKINKKSHRVWAKQVTTYSDQDVGVFGPQSFETFEDYRESVDG